MKSVANFAVGLVGATATLVFATDDYAPKQTYSVGTYHNECAATPCGQLGSLKECSREWYKALDACYAPPCNVRYVRDPAAECKVQDKGTLNAYVQATPTKDSYGQTPAPKSPLRGKYPKCAQPCLKDFLSTDGCNYADVQCHCSKNDAFTKSFETCETNCSASDWQATLIGLITECSRANYPLKAAETKLPSIKRRDRVDDAYPKLPQCAKPCYEGSIFNDGCSLDDCTCHCNKFPEYKDPFFNCVSKDCGPFCQHESYQELERFCKDRGVDLAFPTVSTPVAPSATPGCPLNEYPNVPECSQRCFNATVVNDGCCIGDAACHCTKNDIFQSSLENCVVKDCPQRRDQRSYIKALEGSCKSVCFQPPKRLTLPPRPSATPSY